MASATKVAIIGNYFAQISYTTEICQDHTETPSESNHVGT